jgi:cation:H+ antiporter
VQGLDWRKVVVVAVAAFAIGAAVSLVTSWLLVSRLERIGERLSFSEALLGIVAALAADAPEITAAISALTSHQERIGAGVILGSNVFNLAALLGLGAVVAGRIRLHRKVIALSGTIAIAVALVSLLVVSGTVPPSAGLALALVVVVVYLVVLGTEGQRLRLPARWQAWLRSAVSEEELELEDAIRPSRGRWPDAITAAVALGVVIAASVTMERAASSLGQHLGVPEIITGGLVLAAVTSLPNAVAAVYLASRGRGAATLSTALNSNTLNVVAGLLLPGAVLGLGHPNGQALLVTAWYAGLSLAVLLLAWRHRGLNRQAGTAIIAAYAAFTASLIITSYATSGNRVLSIGLGLLSSLILLVAAGPVTARRARYRHTPGPARVDNSPHFGVDAATDFPPNGHEPPSPALEMPASRRASLLPKWPVRRLWAASMITAAVIAAIDAATGHHLILIGLLVMGPCIALLTAKWLPTTLAGAWACGLAVLLGLPDGIWATATHIAFITAVAIVSMTAAASSAVIGRARR